VDLGLVKRTGTRLSLELVEVPVHSAGELDDAFALMLRRRVDGVTMLSDSMLVANMRRLGELSTAKHLPGAGSDEYAQGGGLLAEGALLRRQDPQGREACGIPVEQASKFELVINSRTARTLGLQLQQSLLLGADQVIE
jgi:putative ABC transport system substrate-binding protein